MPNPIVLIHGYSAAGKAFDNWKTILGRNGFGEIHVLTWQSLVNEINIPDIAEGFDRALRLQAGIVADKPFSAIVHSTGMLVIREWLACNPDRIHRLEHLIGLAPATFGSPVARKGRGVLGSVVKGKWKLGPDFLEAGDLVLDALELASPYNWRLSHLDLFGDVQHYGETGSTPYVFVFCGDRTGLVGQRLAGAGSDGVVRIAGASFNARKITLDFSRRKPVTKRSRVKVSPWTHVDSPVVPVAGADHGSILDKPDAKLVKLVCEALAVKSWKGFNDWHSKAATAWWTDEAKKPRHQQIICRAMDERGIGIEDYAIKLLTKIGNSFREVTGFEDDVDAYSKDGSFRCFHIDLNRIRPERFDNLWVKVILATNTHYAGYTGYSASDGPPDWIPTVKGLTEVDLEITSLLKKTVDGGKFELFYPRTTTFIEMTFDREPLPLDRNICPPIAKFD